MPDHRDAGASRIDEVTGGIARGGLVVRTDPRQVELRSVLTEDDQGRRALRQIALGDAHRTHDRTVPEVVERGLAGHLRGWGAFGLLDRDRPTALLPGATDGVGERGEVLLAH
ncbi:hypothetical protein GCM10025872_36560 [Barrientosiimonas endolithica]|uniref:Uncharacterized protein n=1 Tax=Barrientosiimonas endolithica TaxID=1535208 RepID=A0ABM8HG57_9MICO|nr:hypothetical protein [Barrientosiimonas endolithica]BDZ59999.1 hypothetical protein GCM10025872_36560 [Barrientosiimonas endolithica]